MRPTGGFKRLVRARAEKTGESYTAARAKLLAARPEPDGAEAEPWLATSDEEIHARTGRGREEWFDLVEDRRSRRSGASGWRR